MGVLRPREVVGRPWESQGLGMRILRRTFALAAMAVGVTFASACGSSVSGEGAVSGRSSASSAAATSPTQDPVSSCATKIDTWIRTTFLLGKDDLGDYQEMGLSGAEGMALRSLEQRLSRTIDVFPAAAPADLSGSEVAACQAAGAGASHTIGWQ